MNLTESVTCEQLIEPALEAAGWSWQKELALGPDRETNVGAQARVDYLLSYRGLLLAVVEIKAAGHTAADGMQQASLYARQLSLPFSVATNGHEWILTDEGTGRFEAQSKAPTPNQLLEHLGSSIDWARWGAALSANEYLESDRGPARPYQRVAINRVLFHLAQGHRRALVCMATGTGKTLVAFQLVWQLLQGRAIEPARILVLTDRAVIRDQMYFHFDAFGIGPRLKLDSSAVARREHLAGQVFFATYQGLMADLEDHKVYQHLDPNFFGLVIVDECHRSAFAAGSEVLSHFSDAYQVGLTAVPAGIDVVGYFGEPVFQYTLKEAIKDGYLAPYSVEQRFLEGRHQWPEDKLDEEAILIDELRLPRQTRAIAQDLWERWGECGLRDSKAIIFCIDTTHAEFVADELNRLAGHSNYAARITHAEPNCERLLREFMEVGAHRPRIAVTVEMLATGVDVPDVRSIVFLRPVRSLALYEQMKGRGSRLCEQIGKRDFRVFDYAGASLLENGSAGVLAPRRATRRRAKSRPTSDDMLLDAVAFERSLSYLIEGRTHEVVLGDGRAVSFEQYIEQSRALIRRVCRDDLARLFHMWIDRDRRAELRNALRADIDVSVFRRSFDLPDADEVDLLAKVGFELPHVPTRLERVARLWEEDRDRILELLDETALPDEQRFRFRVWRTALDHYSLFGIDALEQGDTYRHPQFTEQFGSFRQLTERYGGPSRMRADLERITSWLYRRMN